MNTTKTERPANKGLTVRINLWSLEKYLDTFDAERARLWIKGQVKNEETNEVKKFNDAGELIVILGKWNRDKLKSLKEQTRQQI